MSRLPPLKVEAKTEKILIDFLLIVLAISIPYAQVAQHTFTDYDDNGYLFQNDHIRRGLSWDSLVWAFTSTEHANWHPLTWISHLIDRELFGPHPGGYLLMNVAWHALAACLAYLAFLRCTGSRGFALTVALVFALHPVNVENVAWAAERKSILNAVFWFAAVISYLGFIETKSFKAYGLTVIFFVLSLLSKAMSVTLPCTLALINCLYLVYHPAGQASSSASLRDGLKTIVRPIAPLLVLSLYFAVVTASAQTIAMPVNYPLTARAINALLSYERYLVMFFHPTQLAVFYPLYTDSHPGFGVAVPALLLLGGLTLTVLLLVQKKPQLLIGWCWFLGTMVPVIGLVQVGGQSHADRYLYIPMLGLAFVFPVLIEMIGSLGTMAKNITFGVLLSVMSISMMLATRIQVSYWKDGVTLCRHSLEVTGFCFVPMLTMSVTCTRTERFDEFIGFIDSYIAREPSPLNRGLLATIKANVQYRTGKYRAAIETAQRAVAWGYPNKATYALIALSNYELYLPRETAEYLAKTKATPDSNAQNTLAVFSLKSQMEQLDLQLKKEIVVELGSKPIDGKIGLPPEKTVNR